MTTVKAIQNAKEKILTIISPYLDEVLNFIYRIIE